MSELWGVAPEVVTNELIKEYGQNVIPARSGKFLDSQKLDYKEDWKSREYLKHNLAKQRMLFKQEIDQQAEQGELTPSYLNIVKPSGAEFPTIPLEQNAYSGNPLAGPLGLNSSKVPMTYNKLMNSKDMNVNKPMLASIKKANPTWSDKEIILAYNGELTNYHKNSQLSFYAFQTTSSQQEEANRLLPGLLQGSYSIRQLNPDGTITAVEDQEKRREIGQKFKDKNNPFKASVGALGKSLAHTGHVPAGASILPDPDNSGKLYFVENPQTNVVYANQMLTGKLFGFMKNGKDQGNLVNVVDKQTGRTQGVIGRMEYENGRAYEVFYPAKQDASGNLQIGLEDPITVNGKIATAYDMEKLFFDDSFVKSLYPRKRKSDIESELTNPE